MAPIYCFVACIALQNTSNVYSLLLFGLNYFSLMAAKQLGSFPTYTKDTCKDTLTFPMWYSAPLICTIQHVQHRHLANSVYLQLLRPSNGHYSLRAAPRTTECTFFRFILFPLNTWHLESYRQKYRFQNFPRKLIHTRNIRT